MREGGRKSAECRGGRKKLRWGRGREEGRKRTER